MPSIVFRRLFEGKEKVHDSTLVLRSFRIDMSTVLMDDLSAYREADPRTGDVGFIEKSLKKNEDLLLMFRCESHTVVVNGDAGVRY